MFNIEFKPEKRKWMFWLAKLFGRRVIGQDHGSDDYTVTTYGYMWHGKLYLIEEEIERKL